MIAIQGYYIRDSILTGRNLPQTDHLHPPSPDLRSLLHVEYRVDETIHPRTLGVSDS